MQCERCKSVIPEGEEMELHGQVLCEDCYMDLLSPPRACDPWAVYSAKTLLKNGSSELNLSPVQQKILEILQDEGPQERKNLCERLQTKETDLERDLATLRHMERIRGELKGGKKLIRLW
jgi:hypothetical protein